MNSSVIAFTPSEPSAPSASADFDPTIHARVKTIAKFHFGAVNVSRTTSGKVSRSVAPITLSGAEAEKAKYNHEELLKKLRPDPAGPAIKEISLMHLTVTYMDGRRTKIDNDDFVKELRASFEKAAGRPMFWSESQTAKSGDPFAIPPSELTMEISQWNREKIVNKLSKQVGLSASDKLAVSKRCADIEGVFNKMSQALDIAIANQQDNEKKKKLEELKALIDHPSHRFAIYAAAFFGEDLNNIPKDLLVLVDLLKDESGIKNKMLRRIFGANYKPSYEEGSWLRDILLLRAKEEDLPDTSHQLGHPVQTGENFVRVMMKALTDSTHDPVEFFNHPMIAGMVEEADKNKVIEEYKKL